jgi:hypothetical protein
MENEVFGADLLERLSYYLTGPFFERRGGSLPPLKITGSFLSYCGNGLRCWGSIHPAGGTPGSAEAVGPDILRWQLQVPAGQVGSSGGGTGAAVYR